MSGLFLFGPLGVNGGNVQKHCPDGVKHSAYNSYGAHALKCAAMLAFALPASRSEPSVVIRNSEISLRSFYFYALELVNFGRQQLS